MYKPRHRLRLRRDRDSRRDADRGRAPRGPGPETFRDAHTLHGRPARAGHRRARRRGGRGECWTAREASIIRVELEDGARGPRRLPGNNEDAPLLVDTSRVTARNPRTVCTM